MQWLAEHLVQRVADQCFDAVQSNTTTWAYAVQRRASQLAVGSGLSNGRGVPISDEDNMMLLTVVLLVHMGFTWCFAVQRCPIQSKVTHGNKSGTFTF